MCTDPRMGCSGFVQHQDSIESRFIRSRDHNKEWDSVCSSSPGCTNFSLQPGCTNLGLRTLLQSRTNADDDRSTGCSRARAKTECNIEHGRRFRPYLS